mgnify:CR=1 FL=1
MITALVKSLMKFEQQNNFYKMESPKYKQKNLIKYYYKGGSAEHIFFGIGMSWQAKSDAISYSGIVRNGGGSRKLGKNNKISE